MSPNIDEEYKEVLRTESYADVWEKVQGQMKAASFDKVASSSPPSLHLSKCLLEPRQETVSEINRSANLHRLVVKYFEASLKACNVCELLLAGVQRTRANYKIIGEAIKSDADEERLRKTFGELMRFSSLENPLSAVSPEQFLDIQDGFNELLRRLTSKCKKIRRRAKLEKVCKRIGEGSLVISYSALMIAVLALALHSLVGIVAVPCLLSCPLGVTKRAKRGTSTSLLGVQLDAAAKGVYIFMKDFDTMSRQVRSLQEEVEHNKAIAGICVKNGKAEVLKEVVKEFGANYSCFLEKLEELEEHIYLCFLTINRSRRLVVQEIMAAQQRI